MQLGSQHSGLEEKKQRNTNKIGRIAGTKQGRAIIMTIIFYAFHSALRHLLCRVVSLHVMKAQNEEGQVGERL